MLRERLEELVEELLDMNLKQLKYLQEKVDYEIAVKEGRI